MISYYTAIILLSWLALAVLCILVWENSWIPKSDKWRFYLTYAVIALSAFTEWVGLQLSGNDRFPVWLLPLVKCADYILTPMAGGAIVAPMKLNNRWNKALMITLAVNTVFQIVAAFNGWMVVIDESNHYTHGPLYMVYVIMYLLVIVLTATQFRIYGLSYPKQNRIALYSVFLFVIIGIVIQEVLGGEYRTAYISMTVGAAMMFIHFSEFYFMSADARIKQQRSQLMMDALSGVFSRHAYMTEMEKWKDTDKIRDDITAFSIDINGLKAVNDTAGHDAGDKLIIGAARCIEKTIGGMGRCYRIGGDEFVVLARMKKEQIEEALMRLDREAEAWSKDKEIRLSLSAGYARAEEYHGLTVEELVKKADQAMYAVKAEYYQQNGLDRRGLY